MFSSGSFRPCRIFRTRLTAVRFEPNFEDYGPPNNDRSIEAPTLVLTFSLPPHRLPEPDPTSSSKNSVLYHGRAGGPWTRQSFADNFYCVIFQLPLHEICGFRGLLGAKWCPITPSQISFPSHIALSLTNPIQDNGCGVGSRKVMELIISKTLPYLSCLHTRICIEP